MLGGVHPQYRGNSTIPKIDTHDFTFNFDIELASRKESVLNLVLCVFFYDFGEHGC